MEREFRQYLQERKLSAESADFAVKAIRELEKYLAKKNVSFESAGLDALKDYILLLMGEGKNSMDRLLAIARYCKLAKKNDFYVYFTSILGGRNVLPDLGERLATIVGEETRRKVFHGFELPPLGSPPEDYVKLTQTIMNRLEAELPRETCRKILTWNYHKVPTEAFKEKKERFEKADSIDEYLKDEHARFVEELTGFMKEKQIWYEQEITPEVLEFVRGNQEICTGVRRGDRIYATKIPYAPKQYLKENDPTLKRYYACHCPLARSAIRDGKPKISPTFCYCSGGYEKLGFDVIFGESVEVELLESALKGDMRCRFAIKIPRDKMK
ncbi:MAG: hypothetical protein NWE77_04570 [Candidatus Bathyarchaeota archaeon]|jgi:hypothetical protein|nr:hypothetical protein [Candidatus Bathyarchaeota archaeon]